MKCEGRFIYKSIERKEGGEFTNDKGQVIKYNPTYAVKVDEVRGDKIIDRIFKFPETNQELANKFKQVNPYEDIIIAFDIEIYNSNVRLLPIDVICEKE